MLLRRKWEVYSFLTVGDKRVTEPRFLRRCWTKRGAERWGRDVTNSPEILAKSLESLLVMRNGHMAFANYEVKERAA